VGVTFVDTCTGILKSNQSKGGNKMLSSHWKFISILTSILGILISHAIIYTQNGSEIVLACKISHWYLSVIIIIQLILDIFHVNTKRIVCFVIVSHNICFFLSEVVCMNSKDFVMVSNVYTISLVLHLIVAFNIIKSTSLTRALILMGIVSIPIQAINGNYINIGMLLTTLIVSFMVDTQIRDMEIEKGRKRELENSILSLLKHNINNSLSVIGCSLSVLESEVPVRFKSDIENTIKAYEKTCLIINMMGNSGAKRIYELVQIALDASVIKGKRDIEIEIDVDSDLKVETSPVVIVNALIVVINNSVEANASRIKITYKDKRLFLLDNGCGFRHPIRKYFSMKKNGNGVGLFETIRSCKGEKIKVAYKSSINPPNNGTEVVFELENVVCE
jgi:hypothetical protein